MHVSSRAFTKSVGRSGAALSLRGKVGQPKMKHLLFNYFNYYLNHGCCASRSGDALNLQEKVDPLYNNMQCATYIHVVAQNRARLV